jgi:hypothetical protein
LYAVDKCHFRMWAIENLVRPVGGCLEMEKPHACPRQTPVEPGKKPDAGGRIGDLFAELVRLVPAEPDERQAIGMSEPLDLVHTLNLKNITSPSCTT